VVASVISRLAWWLGSGPQAGENGVTEAVTPDTLWMQLPPAPTTQPPVETCATKAELLVSFVHNLTEISDNAMDVVPWLITWKKSCAWFAPHVLVRTCRFKLAELNVLPPSALRTCATGWSVAGTEPSRQPATRGSHVQHEINTRPRVARLFPLMFALLPAPVRHRGDRRPA